MSDNIKVVVKVRPLISREIEDGLQNQWQVRNNTIYQVDSNGRESHQAFAFDKIYDVDTKTADVYNDVAKPIVEAATAGFNGSIFAYGQTSSGKTYTMKGTEDSPGIIQLAVFNLFENIKNVPGRDFLVRVSYLEIYNEQIKDLLDANKENIKIHETIESCIKVDVTEKVISSPEEVLYYMKMGEVNIQTGATNMNEKSSRSHTILQITIESREHGEGEKTSGIVNVSQLNLVDLAGSERQRQTGATGKTFIEGTHINRSLTSLAFVIKQLSDDPNKYVNYRDSKLTRILQNSLGGNAKTSIICAITPAALEETISTLQFATRAKTVKNKPIVVTVTNNATMIQKLTKELSILQSQLAIKKNLEDKLEEKINAEQDLQKQIASLQKFILNGFGQCHAAAAGGAARRRLLPPRRATISALSLDDEPAPIVPKFCTPLLKYNPMQMPESSKYVASQTTKKLPTVAEEPRVVTPPPDVRQVNFSDEVIEIDSDDDDSLCSPTHQCYGSSKTPPCILRKTAKQAEKKYEDIIEFTKREKMFKPSVVEVMEKFEESTHRILKLQEDIEAMKKSSKIKDLEIDHLKIKIKKTDEEIDNAKMQLIKEKSSYEIKLNDLEVSYDTLKKKFKLREEELLSLLEEQKQKKCEVIGRLSSYQKESVMDASKDLSLVISNNENNFTQLNYVQNSEPMTDVVKLQEQISIKNETISQLEANIMSQKQTIEKLEQSSCQLKNIVDSFVEKNSYLEGENMLFKSTIETLKTDVNNYKDNLERAHSDIQSYNSVIRELQIKLTEKDSFVNTNISDSVLESLIANEDKVIANNENMKNIVHAFQIALESRNKEIEQLKTSVLHKPSKDNSTTEDKAIQINTQNNELELSNLKSQISEHVKTINELMHNKSNSTLTVNDLKTKLCNIEKQKAELESDLHSLKETNENLKISLSEKITKEKEYISLNKELLNKNNEMDIKLSQLEETIRVKDNLVATLNEQNVDRHDNIHQAKSVINKLKRVISLLSGKVQDFPEIIDNFVVWFNTLSGILNHLEDVVRDTLSQKTSALQENSKLIIEISDMQNKYDIHITAFSLEIERLFKSLQSQVTINGDLKARCKTLMDEASDLKHEISSKNDLCNSLEMQLKKAIDAHQTVSDEMIEKDKLVSLLTDNEISYETNNNDLKVKLQNCEAMLKIQHEQLTEKVNVDSSFKINQLESQLAQKSSEINSMYNELSDVTKANGIVIKTIFNKICEISKYFDMEKPVTENINYELLVLKILDDLIIHIAQNHTIKLENKEQLEYHLTQARSQIADLEKEILLLNSKLSDSEEENIVLLNKLELVSINNKCQSGTLIGTEDLLHRLKEELKVKSCEIDSMKYKTRKIKEDFITLDELTKQQMQDLHSENIKLENRCLELQNYTQNQIDIVIENTSDYDKIPENPDNKSKTQLNKKISPQNLKSICFNRILEVIEPKLNDMNSVSTSSSKSELEPTARISECAKCDQLSLKLRNSIQENCELIKLLEQVEFANKELLIEQESIRHEVQLLIKPAEELQKRISSHKTNLSILTATTHAENKSLKSQVKNIQHHHTRFYNVCQRDIPEFKRQLQELLTVLKGDFSFLDSNNSDLKRYSLPNVFDSNSTVCNYKNETTLDGDLTVDANVTAGDSTLAGYDQTCLDLTQSLQCEDCSTSGLKQPDDTSAVQLVEFKNNDNLYKTLEVLKNENSKLKELVDKLALASTKVDAQNSPIKSSDPNLCTLCQGEYHQDLKLLTQKLCNLKAEKEDIEKKCIDVCKTKQNEIFELTAVLDTKNDKLKKLQQENDTLSDQLMDNISESEDLTKELNKLKIYNLELHEKYLLLEADVKNPVKCLKCKPKVEVCESPVKNRAHSKFNRSLSDSDTSSTYNKICTLQSELCVGREDCKVLTEDVATIKHHLGCSSNISMDVDETEKIYSNDIQLTTVSQTENFQKFINQECHLDEYTADKIDCYNYYIEKTGVELGNDTSHIKIIEIMKLLYNSLDQKHGNEVENLVNKIRCYEESQKTTQEHISKLKEDYCTLLKNVEDKENKLSAVTEAISRVKTSIHIINDEVAGHESKNHKKVASLLKERFLNVLETDFGFQCMTIFGFIFDKYEDDLRIIDEQCNFLKNKSVNLTAEVDTAKHNVDELKQKLFEKENEFNLLNAQKDKIREISNVVTLNIIKNEQEVNDLIRKGYERLMKLNVINYDSLNLKERSKDNINILFESLVQQQQHRNDEMTSLNLELNALKTTLENKEKKIGELNAQIQTLDEINKSVNRDVSEKESKLQKLNKTHEELNKAYDEQKLQNLTVMEEMTKEINLLKETLGVKEASIASLYEKQSVTKDLFDNITKLKEKNDTLKAVNEIITQEKESYASELQKSCETIKQNNLEIHNMTTDILQLRESLKDATAIIEGLKSEAQTLSKENADLKQNYQEKSRDCLRLENNIKTHEKTAEIQNKMIMRHQKQKKEDDILIGELQAEIIELKDKLTSLREEYQAAKTAYQQELIKIKSAKESLEARVSELEEAALKPRVSIEACPRLRRQSIHDSIRPLEDLEEHRNLESVFATRQKTDDLFADGDEDMSGRSTPLELGKGRDSLLSRTDQSDKDDEHPSRPSSVLATRRRRQSIHDMHRGVARHTPSPNDISMRMVDEREASHSRLETSANRSDNSDVIHLREQLSSCRQELEDLKDKYKELDEECETCSEYLKERDEQCSRLKKEKIALEKQISELKLEGQLNIFKPIPKPSVAHVCVNTDEDWANLHSVVVDRMSYDAEVEKNKRMMKTIEELRFKKLDLKNTLAKMQKALERSSSKETKELEATKEELKQCKAELEELKVRYKELDEECETCSEYLKEREEQCRRLKEAKTTLESKVRELLEQLHGQSSRKKRQTVHDLNRKSSVAPAAELSDAATETSDDFLSHQVERDDSALQLTDDAQQREKMRLKMTVEKLSKQKAALEQQLRATQAAPAHHPVFVATGSAVVQNQQLTDVMKENQRLKKMNAKLVSYCKKRGKSDADRENEDPGQ